MAKPVKNQLERGEFDYLKKGRIYKVSFAHKNLPAAFVPSSTRIPKIYRHFNSLEPIGTLVDGSMVIYLETIQVNHVLFHKIVVDDQVGYVICSHNQFRLKRITSRMLRRTDASVKESNDEQVD